MIDFLGVFIGLVLLCALAALLGIVLAGLTWLLFWKRRRPLLLIFTVLVLPLLSVGYMVLCGILFTIVIPHQPDVFFGDISEPLPNGYLLRGLGKMPEYSYLDRNAPGGIQPPLPAGIKSLEQDGPMLYGAYGPHDQQPRPLDVQIANRTLYFSFDTRTGELKNFATPDNLNFAAGHSVHLVPSELFRSQDPERQRLRTIEDLIYFTPPAAAMLLCVALLLRSRFKSSAELV